MPKSELIARQSAHPRGPLGHVVARVMALDTARVNRRVLACVEPKPGERILELGCGHGRTLGRVAERVAPGGLAVGVDPSEVMCRVARRRNRRFIASAQARVASGSSESIPESDGSFDKVFSVHTLYFWPDLARGLAEIRRVLREGGEVWLGFHPSDHTEIASHLPDSVYTMRSCEDVRAALDAAGFHDAAVTIDEGTHIALAHARA